MSDKAAEKSALIAECDRICGHAKYHRDRCPLYKANCAWMARWNERKRTR